uniref:Putative secreted peptide n=1 Tax=Anopheles braziliensis TaxID=58242 RepID=A0A2M3ZV73_9DIPT
MPVFGTRASMHVLCVCFLCKICVCKRSTRHLLFLCFPVWSKMIASNRISIFLCLVFNFTSSLSVRLLRCRLRMFLIVGCLTP